MASILALTAPPVAGGATGSRVSGDHAAGAAQRERRGFRFDPLPFDAEAARAHGRIYAAVVAAGRKARGARAVDLLIAATACAAELPLYTRNGADFRAIDDLVDIVVL